MGEGAGIVAAVRAGGTEPGKDRKKGLVLRAINTGSTFAILPRGSDLRILFAC
jgi:hypothetical protein